MDAKNDADFSEERKEEVERKMADLELKDAAGGADFGVNKPFEENEIVSEAIQTQNDAQQVVEQGERDLINFDEIPTENPIIQRIEETDRIETSEHQEQIGSEKVETENLINQKISSEEETTNELIQNNNQQTKQEKIPDAVPADTSRKQKSEPSSPKQKHKSIEPEKYMLKLLNSFGERQQLKIITQNLNGPCPLIALCNVLILRGDITIPAAWDEVAVDFLVHELANFLLSHSEAQDANHGQNLQDVMDLIPTLTRGLDVNVGFKSIYSFELNPGLLIFDLCGIKLCHGWVLDREHAPEMYRIVVEECGNYNAVVERIVCGNETEEKMKRRAQNEGESPTDDGKITMDLHNGTL